MFSEKFICAGYDYTIYTSHVPAPYFRKAFEIDGEVKKSVITLTGLGFYELYVNGQRLTKGILAPYISNPDDLVYYDEYDITECLVPGKNVLGIMLGNGMQNAPGGQIWDFDIAAFRGAPRTAFCVSTEYIDGRIDTFEADGSVKTAPSPVIFDDLRCGCYYDARLEIPGWSEPDFDDSAWKNALPAETPRGEKRLCEAEPIAPVREIKPVLIRKCRLKEYITRGDVVKEAKKSRATSATDFYTISA